MKSNLNFHILKLCVSEICLQIGFDRISEQSLNLISDVLKYYIIQISLKLNKSIGSEIFSEPTTKFLIESFFSENSLQEKELISFLKAQNTLKKNLNDIGNNKSLLHCLRILPNDQNFTGIARNNLNDLDYKPKIKINYVNDKIEKDEEMKKFIKNCEIIFLKKKVEKIDINLNNVLEEQKRKRFMFENEKETIFKISDFYEIWNDIQDVLVDYKYNNKHKIFKNIE
ncbi:uncharacterized protein VNE69_05080 [Vairimorpha necatrix]|uniref:Bromodomain associated domain-containing protein n=1 Tax=Vairimorpha necatrix TaxID=6039 RepID=A0AAX4JC51_9MICR